MLLPWLKWWYFSYFFNVQGLNKPYHSHTAWFLFHFVAVETGAQKGKATVWGLNLSILSHQLLALIAGNLISHLPCWESWILQPFCQRNSTGPYSYVCIAALPRWRRWSMQSVHTKMRDATKMCANISAMAPARESSVFWGCLWSKIKWEMGFLGRLAWKRLSCRELVEKERYP